MSISENIRTECKRAGVSQATMLEAVGIGKNYLKQIDNGTSPTAEKLIKIAEYLNCSVDKLLGTENISAGADRKIYLDYFSQLSDNDLKKAYEIMQTVKA